MLAIEYVTDGIVHWLLKPQMIPRIDSRLQCDDYDQGKTELHPMATDSFNKILSSILRTGKHDSLLLI